MATKSDATTTRFGAGSVLFEEGAPALQVFIINAGHVRISRKVFQEPVTVETLGKGNVCGDVALAQGARYPVTATAVDEVEVVAVHRDDLEAVMLTNPNVVARLVSRLAARLTHAHFKVASFAIRDVGARVMLQLRHEMERNNGLGGDTYAHIPFDLPEALAAERSSVDDALRQLARDSLIELDGNGRYRILDLAAYDRRLTYLELRDRFEP